jgi:CDGSH-type Zn-finger protein
MTEPMTEAHVAQKGPFQVELKAGEKYFWCACGLSKEQPWCDGSHKGTGFKPVVFVAEKTETVYMCGCKHTRGRPFCDGTHETL